MQFFYELFYVGYSSLVSSKLFQKRIGNFKPDSSCVVFDVYDNGIYLGIIGDFHKTASKFFIARYPIGHIYSFDLRRRSQVRNNFFDRNGKFPFGGNPRPRQNSQLVTYRKYRRENKISQRKRAGDRHAREKVFIYNYHY